MWKGDESAVKCHLDRVYDFHKGCPRSATMHQSYISCENCMGKTARELARLAENEPVKELLDSNAIEHLF